MVKSVTWLYRLNITLPYTVCERDVMIELVAFYLALMPGISYSLTPDYKTVHMLSSTLDLPPTPI
jgi:hypothetical protein